MSSHLLPDRENIAKERGIRQCNPSSQMKPKLPNVFGFYIYKVTSDTTSKWTYCCVRQWTAEEHDCYMPTVWN